MTAKNYFRDDFQPSHGTFEKKLVNHPKPIPGKPTKSYVHSLRTFLLFDSGIIYERPSTYMLDSPYGWDYFHKAIMLGHKFEQNLNYRMFDEECKVLLNLHLIAYKVNLMKKHPFDFVKEIKEYQDKLRNIFYKYGLLDKYDSIMFELEKNTESHFEY